MPIISKNGVDYVGGGLPTIFVTEKQYEENREFLDSLMAIIGIKDRGALTADMVKFGDGTVKQALNDINSALGNVLELDYDNMVTVSAGDFTPSKNGIYYGVCKNGASNSVNVSKDGITLASCTVVTAGWWESISLNMNKNVTYSINFNGAVESHFVPFK